MHPQQHKHRSIEFGKCVGGMLGDYAAVGAAFVCIEQHSCSHDRAMGGRWLVLIHAEDDTATEMSRLKAPISQELNVTELGGQ